MSNKLSRLRVRCREPEAYKNVVQTAFELRQQVFTGDAFLSDSFLEVRTELILEHAVNTLHFLFLAQLKAVSHDFRFSIATVLSWRKVSFFDSARRLEATLAFQKELHSFSTA